MPRRLREDPARTLERTCSPFRNSDQALADQIVASIKRQIDDRHLRSGTKLPSIRNFAESYKVSRFTVVGTLGNRCRCDAAKVYHLGLIPDRAGFIGLHQCDQLRQQAFRDAGSAPSISSGLWHIDAALSQDPQMRAQNL